MPLPAIGSTWLHHGGSHYKVLMIANLGSQNFDKYPVTVVYENVDTGSVWCRRADDWYRSMVELFEVK
jgi:hypothetical protein